MKKPSILDFKRSSTTGRLLMPHTLLGRIDFSERMVSRRRGIASSAALGGQSTRFKATPGRSSVGRLQSVCSLVRRLPGLGLSDQRKLDHISAKRRIASHLNLEDSHVGKKVVQLAKRLLLTTHYLLLTTYYLLTYYLLTTYLLLTTYY